MCFEKSYSAVALKSHSEVLTKMPRIILLIALGTCFSNSLHLLDFNPSEHILGR